MKFSGKKAQAVTEYILIILFISIFCILAAKFFQIAINNSFENFVFVLSIPIP